MAVVITVVKCRVAREVSPEGVVAARRVVVPEVIVKSPLTLLMSFSSLVPDAWRLVIPSSSYSLINKVLSFLSFVFYLWQLRKEKDLLRKSKPHSIELVRVSSSSSSCLI